MLLIFDVFVIEILKFRNNQFSVVKVEVIFDCFVSKH